jgi:deoxyribonuclease-4
MLGAHVSIAGGVHKAPHNGKMATCEVVQIFTRSNSQWRARKLLPGEVEAFRRAQEETGVRVVCAHDSYLINLASPDRALFRKSCNALLEEMKRCDLLGIPTLVAHPGSHVGSGERKGLARVAEALNRVFDRTPSARVTICLETTAGQGTSLGYRFEHLARIVDQVEHRDRMNFCLDTCHVFAAGYPIETRGGYRKTMKAFNDMLGLDRLRVIHLNDSKRAFDSRVDRHEHIGRGCIGIEAFGFFLNDRRLAKVPKILETPKKSHREDRMNLRTLRSLVKDRSRKGPGPASPRRGNNKPRRPT